MSIKLSGSYKTTFAVGGEFDYKGLVVTAVYHDGSTTAVEPTSVSTPDLSAEGQQIVTVTYEEGMTKVFATYEVSIVSELPEEPYYIRVTSLDDLSIDDKILIINNANGALPAFTGSSTIAATDLTDAYDSLEDRYAVIDEVNKCAITLVAPTADVSESVVFKLKMSNGNYIAKTSTGNTDLNSTSSTDVGGDWTFVSSNDNLFRIKNNFASSREILWRAGTINKFGAYAESNATNNEYTTPRIYKLSK